MKLNEFLSKYDIDFSVKRIEMNEIAKFEELLDTKFGTQLKEYITSYGYIGYKHIEMLGINSVQNEKSDMVQVTLNLRKKNTKINGLIALDNQGDGEYYLVDSNDQMYRYFLGSTEVSKLNIDLESYIVNRLMDT